MSELSNLRGHTVVADTNAHTGKFSSFIVTAAAVVAAITYEDDYTASGDLTDLTSIPAGSVIPMRATSVTLTSGEGVLVHL